MDIGVLKVKLKKRVSDVSHTFENERLETYAGDALRVFVLEPSEPLSSASSQSSFFCIAKIELF